MTWLPWKRKAKRDKADGQKARADAERNLRDAEAQWPAVRDVSASLRRMQRRNNFAEAIERIMRGNA